MASEIFVQPGAGDPTLITILKSKAQVRVTRQGLTSLEPSLDVSSLQNILVAHGASLQLLFGPSEDRVQLEQSELLRSATAPLTVGEEPDAAAALKEVCN